MARWMDGWMDMLVDGWIDVWAKGWIGELTYNYVNAACE